MRWFNNMKVGRKVLLACMIFLLMISAMALIGFVNARASSNNFGEFYNDLFEPANLLNQTMQNILQRRINMVQAIDASMLNDMAGVRTRLDNSQKIAAENAEMWKKYKATYMTADEKKLADDYEKSIAPLLVTYKKFIAAVLARDDKTAREQSKLWLDDFQNVRDKLDKLIDIQENEGKKLKAAQERAFRTQTVIFLAVWLFAVGLSAFITIILARGVSGPVNKGLEFAKKIAAGDLTGRIKLDQEDELGMLGKSLNEAADNLEKLISEIIIGSQNLSQAVEQISSGNQNLSQRTSEQASSLEEIASTIEQATAAINQNYENSQEASRLADNSSRVAEDGGSMVGQAVDSINEMSQTSNRIAEIISVINDIAFQTNLLALNAAVEAARAGEQGRGFAVVAGEVRNLAQRSAGASKEIGDLIKDSLARIADATEKANRSRDVLANIITSVKSVSRVVAEITASSNEQKQGINQINTAISEMDNMTQQNASLVEETASASEEMANQSLELMSMMDRFKISDNYGSRPNGAARRGVPSKTPARAAAPAAAPADRDVGKNTEAGPGNAQGTNQLRDMLRHDGFEEF